MRAIANAVMGKGAGVALLSVLLAVLSTGCQTPGKLISVKDCPVCPMCKTETRTAAVKGLTYRKTICPGCRKVSDSGTWMESQDLTSVVVCDKCKAVMANCPGCAH